MGSDALWEMMSDNILIAINILLLGIQIYLFRLLRDLIKKDAGVKGNQTVADVYQKNASKMISEKYLIKLEDELPAEHAGEEAKKSMKNKTVEKKNKEKTKEDKTKKRKRKKLF